MEDYVQAFWANLLDQHKSWKKTDLTLTQDNCEVIFGRNQKDLTELLKQVRSDRIRGVKPIFTSQDEMMKNRIRLKLHKAIYDEGEGSGTFY